MAETLISPGVLARENDQSFISAQPVQAGAALLGPTVKGQVGIPTLVTTYSEYQNVFGTKFKSGSGTYTFLTSIAAYNYFNNGGDSLLVTRCQSMSFTPASSSAITNNENVTGGVEATGSNNFASADVDFTAVDDELRIIYDGNTYRFVAANPAGGGIPQDQAPYLYFFETGSSTANGVSQLSAKIDLALSGGLASSSIDLVDSSVSTTTLILSASNVGTAYNGMVIQSGSGSSFDTAFTLGGGVAGVGNTEAFVLCTLGQGILMNNSSSLHVSGALATTGSSDNVRWEIQSPNTSSGTFSLIIRRGDDNQKSKVVLETFTNVSLDPNSSNYIAKQVGDQVQQVRIDSDSNLPYLETSGSYANASKYVRVKSVNTPTPDYLDNNGDAKAQYTSSIPNAGSGSEGGAFGGAAGTIIAGSEMKFYQNITNTNSQGLIGDNYTQSLQLLANKDDFKYNMISAPGLVYSFASHVSPLNTMMDNAENRGDNIAILDLKSYGATVAAPGVTAGTIDSSYTATYWPWCSVTDPDTGQLCWVPASTLIPGVYAYNDTRSEPWFAPAGINRGGLNTVVRTERKLTQANRDSLYSDNVNPIATFPNTGVVVFGQKTLQKKASALDRVNVRRLLIALKSHISQVADQLVFEQNSIATRNSFLSQVNPYLESVQQRQGLYAFKVVMDSSNNTPDVIDRNEMVGAIYLQPTKTAEFIILDFNVMPTGATFPS